MCPKLFLYVFWNSNISPFTEYVELLVYLTGNSCIQNVVLTQQHRNVREDWTTVTSLYFNWFKPHNCTCRAIQLNRQVIAFHPYTLFQSILFYRVEFVRLTCSNCTRVTQWYYSFMLYRVPNIFIIISTNFYCRNYFTNV